MGATNTTTYYNLSQFVGTDKPAWLQDYNGDMLKIDTAINAAKVAADSAALDASAAQLDATTALGDITNTITPAITSLQTTVGNQGGAINTINSLIGNGTPTTTDQTIIGAINEINANVTVKTMSITAATTLSDIAAKITGSLAVGHRPYLLRSTTGKDFAIPLQTYQANNRADFSCTEGRDDHIYFHNIKVSTSNTQMTDPSLAAGGFTASSYTNLTDTTTLYYYE